MNTVKTMRHDYTSQCALLTLLGLCVQVFDSPRSRNTFCSVIAGVVVLFIIYVACQACKVIVSSVSARADAAIMSVAQADKLGSQQTNNAGFRPAPWQRHERMLHAVVYSARGGCPHPMGGTWEVLTAAFRVLALFSMLYFTMGGVLSHRYAANYTADASCRWLGNMQIQDLCKQDGHLSRLVELLLQDTTWLQLVGLNRCHDCEE